MNKTTEKLIDAVLEMDPNITADQRNAAVAVLNGRTPEHWLPLQHFLEKKLAPKRQDVNKGTPEKVYLRRHDAARYIGCCVRLIDSLKHNGDLPFHRLGRRLIVFKVDDLDSLMRKKRISVDDEVEG